MKTGQACCWNFQLASYPLLTWSPNRPARSAATSRRVATLLPMEAILHLALPSTAALPVRLPSKGLLGLTDDGSESASYPGASLLEKRLCFLRSGKLQDRFERQLRPVVYPSARFEGQPRVQNSFQVTCSLPEGFDGDEGRRLLVRQPARLFSPTSITTSLPRSIKYSSVTIATPTTVSPPSPAMLTSTLTMSNFYSAIEACHLRGGYTVLAGMTTMPMSYISWRRTAKALIVLTVTRLRARHTFSYLLEDFHSFPLKLHSKALQP